MIIIHRPGRWLPPGLPQVNRLIVENAMSDIGIYENPPGSNRGPEIDGMNHRAGVPIGSYWCAVWAGQIWEDSEARIPPAYPSCDSWVKWAKELNLWHPLPAPGAAVLYRNLQNPLDAVHIGIVVRVSPVINSVEGNTTVSTQFSRNGVAVDFKEVDLSRVMGYVYPIPR